MFLSLRQKAGTQVQREDTSVVTELRNGVTVVGALGFEEESFKYEQAAGRKPCNGGIVPEANACGNAQDMQTGTR
jgi:hypothetical protein